MRMKYIVVEIDGQQMPILFPDSPKLSHKAVWRGVQQGLRMDARESRNGGSWHCEPISMGFANGVSATSVDGYSESARYGFDSVPRDMWSVTEAHPEIDLPLINGGRSIEQVLQAKADAREATAKDNEEYVAQILLKKAPEARHKSPAGRWDTAIKYLEDRGSTYTEAKAIVTRVATEKTPGAYKIP